MFLPVLILFLSAALQLSAKNVTSIFIPSSEYLFNRDAITIIFSSAVVKLGFESNTDIIKFVGLPDNFPGRARWVTTSIYRFDPFIDWTNDLNFTVVVPEFQNFHGDIVTSNAKTYKTQTSHWSIAAVASQQAQNLTGNHWMFTSLVNYTDIIEVPPDGNITVVFSGAVNQTALPNALRVRDSNGNDVPFQLTMSNESKTTIFLVLQANLTVGQPYEIFIPKGSSVLEFGGKSAADDSKQFFGLLPFKFHFLDDVSPPNSLDYRLYLRHGLLDPSEATLQRLKAAIAITPAVDFNLSVPEKYYVRLQGQYLPATDYTIRVSADASILDGFSLPLLGSDISFTTNNQSSFYIDAMSHGEVVQFDSFNTSWIIFNRQLQDPTTSYFCYTSKVGTRNVNWQNMREALATLRFQRTDYTNAQVTPISHSNKFSVGQYEQVSLDLNDAWGTSGLFLYNKWTSCSYGGEHIASAFYSKNDMNLAGLVSQSRAMLWVTNGRASEPASSKCRQCTVRLYGIPHANGMGSQSGADSVLLLNQTKTDDDGFASIDLSRYDNYASQQGLTLYFAVENSQTRALQVTPELYYYSTSANRNQNRLHYSITTDKGFYKPGELVHVKGYAREEGENVNEIGANGAKRLVNGQWKLSVKWSTQDTPEEHIVTLSSMGTFNLSLNTPLNATFGSHELALYPQSLPFSSNTGNAMSVNSDYYRYAMSFSVLIADPRVPTFVFALTSNTTQVRSSYETIPCQAALATYTGIPISNATLLVRWRFVRANPLLPMPVDIVASKAAGDSIASPNADGNTSGVSQGSFNVTTDANGLALFNVTIAGLLGGDQADNGDLLTLSVDYMTMTKELLQQSMAVAVQKTPLTLTVAPSIAGRVQPLTSFGAFLSLTADASWSASHPKPDQKLSVSLSLYESNGFPIVVINKATGETNVTKLKKVQDCQARVSIGSERQFVDCNFSLPSMGNFVLYAETPFDEYLVHAIDEVGETEEQWSKRPLADWNALEATLVKDVNSSFSIGDTATVQFYSPYQRLSVLALFPGSDGGKIAASQSYEGPGLMRLAVPLLRENVCQQARASTGDAACTLTVLIAKYDDGNRANKVPTSVLFNYSAFTSFQQQLEVVIKNKQANYLNVAITAPDQVLPGQQSTIEVTVTDAQNSNNGLNGNGDKEAYELCFFVVDQAVLDLAPVPLLRFNESDIVGGEFVNSFASTQKAVHSGYRATQATIQRRLTHSPYYVPSWPLTSSAWSTLEAVDMSDDAFFAAFNTRLTEFPPDYWPLAYRGGLPAYRSATHYASFGAGGMVGAVSDALASKAAYDGAAESAPMPNSNADQPRPATPPLTVRTKMLSTPLFIGRLPVNASGRASVTWQVPDNIAKFQILVYAISKTGLFGSSTRPVISTQALSLTPSLPRIVRTSDEYLAGVTVQVHDAAFDDEVTVSLYRACDLLALVGPPNITQRMTGPNVYKVDFRFKALGTGSADLLFAVTTRKQKSSEGGEIIPKDAALFKQDILGRQEAIFIATSMAVSQTSEAIEGFQVPQAEEFSGVLDIIAGVGRYASVSLYVKHVLAAAAEPLPSAYDLLAALATRTALARYDANTDPDLAATIAAKSRKAQFDRSLRQLETYFIPSYGLQYKVFSNNPFYYVNIPLQAFALFVFKELNMDWHRAELEQVLQRELYSQVSQTLASKHNFSSFDELARIYLGMGADWKPSEYADQLSLENLIKNKDNLSNTGKTMLAVALQRDRAKLQNSKIDVAKTVASLMDDIQNLFRVQGRTAYLTSSAGQQQPSFVASALGLSAFVYQQNTLALVEKLANFLPLESPSSQAGRVPIFLPNLHGELNTYLMLALSAFDEWKGNTQPDLLVNVTSANKSLANFSFQKQQPNGRASNSPTAKQLYFEQIPDLNDIQFTAQGKGEASLVFGATFVPLNISNEKTYRGIEVNKVIREIDPETREPIGPPLNRSTLGKQVIVTIEITIPDYSEQIIIVDPLPGCLEAVDENLFVGPVPEPRPAQMAMMDSSSSASASFAFTSGPVMPGRANALLSTDYWDWYIINMFRQRQFRPDKVIFSGTHVRAGTHSVQYIATVATEGLFTLPPTKAYDVNQPELMGLSPGGSFNTTTFDDVYSPSTATNTSCLPWTNRRLDKRHLPMAWMAQLAALDLSASEQQVDEGTPATTRPTRSMDVDNLTESDMQDYASVIPVFGFVAILILAGLCVGYLRKVNADRRSHRLPVGTTQPTLAEPHRCDSLSLDNSTSYSGSGSGSERFTKINEGRMDERTALLRGKEKWS